MIIIADVIALDNKIAGREIKIESANALQWYVGFMSERKRCRWRRKYGEKVKRENRTGRKDKGAGKYKIKKIYKTRK